MSLLQFQVQVHPDLYLDRNRLSIQYKSIILVPLMFASGIGVLQKIVKQNRMVTLNYLLFRKLISQEHNFTRLYIDHYKYFYDEWKIVVQFFEKFTVVKLCNHSLKDTLWACYVTQSMLFRITQSCEHRLICNYPTGKDSRSSLIKGIPRNNFQSPSVKVRVI